MFYNINKVFIEKTQSKYPTIPPFNPPKIWPEYPYDDRKIDENNNSYLAFRNLLYKMSLDEEHFDHKEWNPFKDFVKKGDTIVIKPNFVHDKHSSNTDEGFISLITHSSLIRAVIDYSFIGVGTTGEILVADTPLDICNFDNLLLKSGLKETINYLNIKNIPSKIIDLREPKNVLKEYSNDSFKGDPLGYEIIDLASRSSFQGLDSKNPNYQTVADKSMNHFDPYSGGEGKPNKYHNNQHHIYRIPRTILNADFVISFAKMKTHKKTGVTLTLKNMIGIISGKEYIPHFMKGPPPNGDEIPPSITRSQIKKRALIRTLVNYSDINKCIFVNSGKILEVIGLKKVVYRKHPEVGSWYGNDTIWRTVVDANKILIYCDRYGKLKKTPQRNYLAFIDGIICGDGEGPLASDPKKCGILLGGFNPVVIDSTCARIMGFDPEKIKTIDGASKEKNYPLGCLNEKKIQVIFNNTSKIKKLFNFNSPSGFKGHIELDDS